MDYIKEVICRLEEYESLVTAVKNLKEELKALSLEKDLIKAQKLSFTPAKSYGEPDDKLVDNIHKRIEIRNRLKITENRIKQIDRAMNGMELRDKQLLELLFIKKYPIEYVCEELKVEKSQIYRKRIECLKKIGRSLLGYGVA